MTQTSQLPEFMLEKFGADLDEAERDDLLATIFACTKNLGCAQPDGDMEFTEEKIQALDPEESLTLLIETARILRGRVREGKYGVSLDDILETLFPPPPLFSPKSLEP